MESLTPNGLIAVFATNACLINTNGRLGGTFKKKKKKMIKTELIKLH